MKGINMDQKIASQLKEGPEQQKVVGPLVEKLVGLGWSLAQIVFGKSEWRVPKTPSEAAKRELGNSYDGFPVDIAVFDSPENCRNYRHLLFIVECKQPDLKNGLQELETYLSLEPFAKLGIWSNSPDPSQQGIFVYKTSDGLALPKKKTISKLPFPGMKISPETEIVTFNDLITPTPKSLHDTFDELLDKIVARDGNVTRREDQLDQLCNIILLKLDSDKTAKMASEEEVEFHPCASAKLTAKYIKEKFTSFYNVYPDIFTNDTDKEIKLSDSTVHECVELLSPLNLLGLGGESVSIAFQVLRSAALREQEGQYFTPSPVIQAAIQLLDFSLDDIIIDPACGTGGFLVQCLLEMQRRYPNKNMIGWASLKLFGIDKDSIAIKLTKAIMQILGDGSAHCDKGDSVLTNTWPAKYPHLMSNLFSNGRFTRVFTNPPFGQDLTVKYADAKAAGLSIIDYTDPGVDIDLGLAMFNRCCDLLAVGGKMCIVLPETYLFSPSYKFVREWMKTRLIPICVANVPMDAFQGFCRAKTNLYVFEKADPTKRIDYSEKFVEIINSKTCGIYKNGSPRFKVTQSGERTKEIDNELLEMSSKYHKGQSYQKVCLADVIEKDVLVPQYYDESYEDPLKELSKKNGFKMVSLGELIDQKIVTIFGGHGSPSNDIRNGSVPYVKVSDIRNLRINVNPTNLIALELAKKFWKTKDGKSNLRGWDLISPNRASSNIGEFAVLLPGEEQIVLTKEVFVVRVCKNDLGIDPFYLLWAFSLKAVRDEWRRVTLMQTNREDVGNRYREILVPLPPDSEWAKNVSKAFRNYFQDIAIAKEKFAKEIGSDPTYSYLATVSAFKQ
jgi:type I restriction enzyme M protein